ncbi:MAG: MFS transporter [Hyphomicrobiales bacterium]|nr:MAG: MFS transporter [Hyphomicrobiales bacterium]
MESPTGDTKEVGESNSPRTNPRRAAFAAFLGTLIEFYDLVIYSTAAALVFGQVFFRDVSPQVALILSFATFASGYLVRPVGGLVFGYIGDRFGRRTALMITIVMMGTATVLIGVLPTYAVAGALAPVLLVLLRLVQGIAVGGEQGGAMLIAVEHAPPNKRGFYGSFSTTGSQGGTVVAAAVFALITLMPEDAFMTWGWRVPFLLSALIVVVGVLVRYGIEESPDFEEVRRSGERPRNPIREALTKYPGVIVGIALVMSGVFAFWYILTVYCLSYAVKYVGVDRTTMLWLIALATVLVMIMNPVWGALSDRIGRTKLVAGGLMLDGVLLFVYFGVLKSGNVLLVGSVLAIIGCCHAMFNGVFPAFIAESLPPKVRYTAGSFGLQLAGVVGGLAPLVAVALEGSRWGVSAIPVVCLALCSLGAISAYSLVAPRKPSESPTSIEPAEVSTSL